MTTETPDPMRDFARQLFAPDKPFVYQATTEDAEDDAERPDPTLGNRVPKEGTSLATGPTGNDQMRQFARDLFTHTPLDY